ncbi:DUF1176 domain-containing protein [uncultured Cohaesibacter sp.]|uniref:DUF1176 domain-containing protein n=1 Tax=uncultured Cohaesibacter sp. TaxID=1002546 RepID=UPI0029C7E82D|nr:DUF1176 domain-containing protein [uncultured Cohaesibacter sp.]
MMKQPLLAAMMLSTALLASQPVLAGNYKEFRDVAVWCDTAMNCSLTLVPKSFEGVTELTLRRENRLDNSLSIMMTSQKPIEPGTRFLISIDDNKSLTLIADVSSIKEDGAKYWNSNPDVAEWLIEGIKSGSMASVKMTTGDETISTSFSLSGSVAGMIYIDEYQDLLNTSYALQVKGSQAPRPRVPITEIKSQTQIPQIIWDKWFEQDGAMCHFFGSTAALEAGLGFRLTLHSADLYGLPCGMGGAYNQPYAFFTVPLDETNAITQTPFIMDGKVQADENGADAWNISFSGKDFTLKSEFKGRGIGDCGSQFTWQLREEGERIFFDAVELREKGECDGDYAGGPDNWPVTWPK